MYCSIVGNCYLYVPNMLIRNCRIYVQGGPHKSLWCDLEEILKYFWWGFSLYIFTSSQEVRAF